MSNEITIYRGDSRTITVTVTDSTGAAFDLTSYDTITFIAKSSLTLPDASAEITKTGSPGADPTLGVITVNLTSDDTAVAINNYYYEVEIRNTSVTPNIVYTVVQDILMIKVDVSNIEVISNTQLYLKPAEMRILLQFDKNDYPSDDDIGAFIELAQIRVDLDMSSTNTGILKFATFLLAKYYIMRSLATRSVAKGYITVNAEGRQVTKAFQELVLEGENTYQEYKEFINSNLRSEVTSTNFMSNTTIINSTTRQQFIDMWTGTQNAMDYDNQNNKMYGRMTRN